MGAKPGLNVTVTMHIAPGARALQLFEGTKLASELVMAPMLRVVTPVFESAIVCCVDADPGVLLKASAVGLIASPGSSAPLPLSCGGDSTGGCGDSEGVPVRRPVAVGEKMT